MVVEFPKSLYLKGWDDLSATIVVGSADEEAAARAEGYRMLSEPAPEPAPEVDDEPAKRGPGRPRKAD